MDASILKEYMHGTERECEMTQNPALVQLTKCKTNLSTDFKTKHIFAWQKCPVRRDYRYTIIWFIKQVEFAVMDLIHANEGHKLWRIWGML